MLTTECISKLCGLLQKSFSFFSQVKFSELTIDMFRMLQALEREPVNLATQSTKPGTLVREDSYTLPVTLYVECFWVFSPFHPRGSITSPLSASLSLCSFLLRLLSLRLSHSFISLCLFISLSLIYLSHYRSPMKSRPSERILINISCTNQPSASFTLSCLPPSRFGWCHYLFLEPVNFLPVLTLAQRPWRIKHDV